MWPCARKGCEAEKAGTAHIDHISNDLFAVIMKQIYPTTVRASERCSLCFLAGQYPHERTRRDARPPVSWCPRTGHPPNRALRNMNICMQTEDIQTHIYATLVIAGEQQAPLATATSLPGCIVLCDTPQPSTNMHQVRAISSSVGYAASPCPPSFQVTYLAQSCSRRKMKSIMHTSPSHHTTGTLSAFSVGVDEKALRHHHTKLSAR